MTTRARPLREADLPPLAGLIDRFAAGHPAADQPRPLPALAEACLGPRAVWNVGVAERDDRLVGFLGWKPLFDLFACSSGL